MTGQLLVERIIADRSPELMRGIREILPAGPANYAITREDIDEGEPGDGDRCPLSRVIRRAFPGAVSVCIAGEHPYFTDAAGARHPLILDQVVTDWIGRLDRGEPVESLAISIRPAISASPGGNS